MRAMQAIVTALAAVRLPAAGPRSESVPFLARPAALDGSMVGDAGFDPLGLATASNLERMREAEVKHGRLAMVACWGWPVGGGGLWIAQKLVPPSSVCSGNGCLIDASRFGEAKALSLGDIAALSTCWWGALLLAAVLGEVRARTDAGTWPRPAFDPLRLADVPEDVLRDRRLAELKHGRLAMVALLSFWCSKLWSGNLTFAHQLFGETCVLNAKAAMLSGSLAPVCYVQTVPSFDFVLSWEIMFRVITGYFAEPYF